MTLQAKVIEAAQEIFSTMVMMEVSAVEGTPDGLSSFQDSISGVIGLTGTHKGVLAIHLPHVVAMAITGSFLGMDVDSINEDVEDAVGELANMMGGNVKSILSEKGRDIELSMPTTIQGKRYEFEPTREVERLVIPFTSENGDFSIELQLEK